SAAARRLIQVTNLLPAAQGGTISQHTYAGLDGLGNRTHLDEVLWGVAGTTTTTYGYDGLAQLTQVNQGQTSYAYDAAGNRTSRTRSGTPTTTTYDKADRLTK